MGRLAHAPNLERARIRLALRWMCLRYGHAWDASNCNPPSCRDCGRTGRPIQ